MKVDQRFLSPDRISVSQMAPNPGVQPSPTPVNVWPALIRRRNRLKVDQPFLEQTMD